MDSDLHALELPAFELDCREWLVATPDDGSVPEEVAGAPVVAVLSTAVVRSTRLAPASAVLSIGLLDEPAEDERVTSVRLDADSPVAELIDVAAGSARYLVPAPDGRLALLAEFTAGSDCAELLHRFQQLMASFRWADQRREPASSAG